MPQSNAVEIAGLDHINIQTPVAADYNAWFVGDRERWRQTIEETGIKFG